MKFDGNRQGVALLTASLGLLWGSCQLPGVASAPLRSQPLSQLETPACPRTCLGLDEQLWGRAGRQGDRRMLVAAVDQSLQYLRTPEAAKAYQNYPIAGITRDRVERSLKRFRQLLLSTRSAKALQQAVQREFVFYEAVGKDGQGTVDFTGYYEAVYTASRKPTRQFRYPLYRLPPDFTQWSKPHPTREQLEGVDGLQGSRGVLRGLELVWLRDRLQAFLVHVQGSARLRLTDGSTMTVGYAGRTNYPYTSIGKELVKDGKFPLENLTLQIVIDYLSRRPAEMNRYLPRNTSFVFFKETFNAPAKGSLRVPVTAERSIATDKSLMPPGALALIQTDMPIPSKAGKLQSQFVNRYVLDQDTGSAIRGPGRVDIFMGTGSKAKERAGLIRTPGKLLYLFLK